MSDALPNDSPASSTLPQIHPNGSTPPPPHPIQPAPDKKKKKKKKKQKKTANSSTSHQPEPQEQKPPVLCINRNKHWKYISSYHGPWLQLPIELLESLMLLNLNPATLSLDPAEQFATPSYSSAPSTPKPRRNREHDRVFYNLNDLTPPDSPRIMPPTSPLALPPPFPPPIPGKPTPPPFDPGIFRSVTRIRRLIDEASELSVRASSGLSSSELNAMRNGGGMGGLGANSWAAAQTLGLNPLGPTSGNGRQVAMSATRVHRLRALAVSKLAEAYKLDEIASSVMVMQGGSVFDDLAERVLKVDPTDVDAKYVHFFHEKIPSRQLSESTPTTLLDEIIAAQPHRLEFYRTRGVVHCFRDEYSLAIKDFTHALKVARNTRKAHDKAPSDTFVTTKNSRRKRNIQKHRNGQAPADGTSTPDPGDTVDPDSASLRHPSCMPDAPDPIEHQLLFHRGAAYLQHAIHLIESEALALEGIDKVAAPDGAELRLCYLRDGNYGGVEVGSPDGPLGPRTGAKFLAYHETLGNPSFRDNITSLIKKSIRDHEKFIAQFDTLDSPGVIPDGDLAHQVEYSFLLSESLRPGNQQYPASSNGSLPHPPMDVPAMFTTYHPLLVEAHFSILICQVLLADFETLIPNFIRTASLVDGLQGYPIFLPPRSMSQAEFIEVLERLAGGWQAGIQPHSFSKQLTKRKEITAPASFGPLSLSPSISSPPDSPFGTPVPSTSTSFHASEGRAPSSASSSFDDDADLLQPGYPSRPDAAEALDHARILLAPVHQRQKERSSLVKDLKKGSTPPSSLSIPLHGPRVEIMLAWLAAVHLPELEAGLF